MSLLNINLEFFSSKHVNFNHFCGHVYLIISNLSYLCDLLWNMANSFFPMETILIINFFSQLFHCRFLPCGNSYCAQHLTADFKASHELFLSTRINVIIYWGNNLKIIGFSKCILFCSSPADWNRSLSDTMNNEDTACSMSTMSHFTWLDLEYDWNSSGIWIPKSEVTYKHVSH